MVFKKNILSYCLWILYTVATAAGLFSFAAYICFKMGYPAWNGLAACLCLLLAEALACAFFHVRNKRVIKIKKRHDAGRIGIAAAEGLTVAVIFGILLAMRIASMSGASPQSPFFDQAMVQSGVKIEPSFHTAAYIYLKALHFVFLVFGNKITAGYIFQIVLQLLSFVMLYFAVRKISGVLPAVFAVLFPGIISNFNDAALTLSPRTMLVFIFALGLLLVSACFVREGRRYAPAVWLAAGIYIGFISGIETAACVLLFISLGSNFVQNSNRRVREALFCTIAMIIGTAAGFIGCIFFNAVANDAGFEIAFGEWIRLINPEQISAGQLLYMPFLGYDNAAVLLALCLGIFTFFLNNRSYGQGIWTFTAVILTAFAVTDGSAEECAAVGMLYTVLTILAGIAIKNIFPVPETAPAENVTGEDAVLESTVTEDNDVEDLSAVIGEKEKNSMFSGKNKDRKTKNDELSRSRNTAGTPGEIVTVNVDGESRQIKLLDNPLTLPKKREHKAMDYDYEVAEDDDYDIK